jgi:hypothetical protein
MRHSLFFLLPNRELPAKTLPDAQRENAVMENGIKQCYITTISTAGYGG